MTTKPSKLIVIPPVKETIQAQAMKKSSVSPPTAAFPPTTRQYPENHNTKAPRHHSVEKRPNHRSKLVKRNI